jgi:hypothetical protein
LVFSYVGFETFEALVGTRTVVDVTMNSADNVLGDVVVTALGIKRESKKLGYSATTANVEELATTNRTTNMMGSLEGKVAGLNFYGCRCKYKGTFAWPVCFSGYQ